MRLLLLSQLILALARPQWGASEVEVEQEGIDLVVALDVSRRCWPRTSSPAVSRAKVELADLMDRLAGDRVGLVFLAGAGLSAVSSHRRLCRGSALPVPGRTIHDR